MSIILKIFTAVLCLLIAVPANAKRHMRVVNAQCGPANGVPSSTAPTTGLCALGNATPVFGGDGSPWMWTCDGLNGGSNAMCSAPYQVAVINGACGPANGVPTNGAPSSGLCSAGNATPVTGSGPWAWTCQGSGGGTTASCNAPLQTASTGGQDPGPSAALFNSPYYQCVTNHYVSTSGSDSNNGSQSAPWKTLQHADSANVGAGACINVAPGTYDGVLVHNGGNAATATGYVVYRCQQMDTCTVTGNAGLNGNSSVWFDAANVTTTKPNTVNYVQFDGFNFVAQPLASQGAYDIGFVAYNFTNGPEVASHHIWMLNSTISGFGQSGYTVGASDYFYAIHNIAFDNALAQCDAQGSGIAINIAHDVPGYTPTQDDQIPFAGFGFPTWELGDGTFFHVVFAYNVAYNNRIQGCSRGTVTDGNGIIFDTNAGPDGNSTDYHNPMLAYGNVSYNNGGGGVHITSSFNVWVVNNTVFNNYIDPDLFGGSGDTDDNGGGNVDNGVTYTNHFYNNIAVACTSAFPASSIANGGNNAILLGPTAGDDPAQGNVTGMATGNAACGPEVNLFNSQTYDTTKNKVLPVETTDQIWVDVPFSAPGTDATLPGGTNFALQPGSPAIGYGITKPYLPSSSVDAGACPSTLTACP
jgi:hypothetical protein